MPVRVRTAQRSFPIPFGYDPPIATRVTTSNAPAAGGAPIGVTGANYGSTAYSQRARAGGSACQATSWASDTSVVCSVHAGLGYNRSLTVTVGMGMSTLASALSYDRPLPSGVAASNVRWAASNVPTAGSSTAQITGTNFAVWSWTLSARIGGSACLATHWQSSSSLTCKVPAGVGAAKAVAVTADMQVGSLLGFMAYDIASSMSAHNAPAMGRTVLTVSGTSFGVFDSSLRARVGHTACTSTVWASDTSLKCGVPKGLRSSLSITVSSGAGLLQTRGTAISYDLVVPASVFPSNGPVTGGTQVTISAVNLGAFDISPRVRLGATACPSSTWVSDSTILCKIASNTSIFDLAKSIVVTVGDSLATRAAAFQYDAIADVPLQKDMAVVKLTLSVNGVVSIHHRTRLCPSVLLASAVWGQFRFLTFFLFSTLCRKERFSHRTREYSC